jgi:hypothetical protein
LSKSVQSFPRKSPGSTDRQTHRQTDKQTDRQTDSQKDRLNDRGGSGIKTKTKTYQVLAMYLEFTEIEGSFTGRLLNLDISAINYRVAYYVGPIKVP